LLQASTSIISIAESSKQVLEAIQEAKRTIKAREPPRALAKVHGESHGGASHLFSHSCCLICIRPDTQLRTLQLLSAHLKLLLDAPEHLWRLIETKKYFNAAWLYMFARVVHRSLVRDDENDEERWTSHGVNVMVYLNVSSEIIIDGAFLQEQFPLIQRQWESIQQFRAQIVHKATGFLREISLSTEV
jgi:conserved oligomeric Golgi complex subunit 1